MKVTNQFRDAAVKGSLKPILLPNEVKVWQQTSQKLCFRGPDEQNLIEIHERCKLVEVTQKTEQPAAAAHVPGTMLTTLSGSHAFLDSYRKFPAVHAENWHGRQNFSF